MADFGTATDDAAAPGMGLGPGLGRKRVTVLPLISADSHVLEPPDLWTSRLPAKFQDRAPKQVRGEQGDTWQFPSSPPWAYGLNQCGGLPTEKYSTVIKWEDVRP